MMDVYTQYFQSKANIYLLSISIISGPLVYNPSVKPTLYGVLSMGSYKKPKDRCMKTTGHFVRVSSPEIHDWINNQIQRFTKS